MVFVETSFPRGGTAKPDVDGSSAALPSHALQQHGDIEFGATTFKRKKEKLTKRKRDEQHIRDNADQRDDKIEAVSAELLSLRTITEGMLVMGCISKIEHTHVLVALPGRLSGRVLVTAMAPAYVDIVNKYVHDVENVQGYKTLDEMFTVGQIVSVKVMQIRAGAEQARALIELSLNPADVQADLQHKRIAEGAVLCAAVSDIEDHGYVLNTGIANLRAFMPSEEAAEQNGNLGIGEVIFVRVKSAKTAAAASTIVCSAIAATAERQHDVAVSGGKANLAGLLPSAVLTFTVTKRLRDGLQGTVLDDTFTAYANEHQLARPLAVPEDYEIGAELQARVLYVMPLTKLVYVSLNLRESICAASGTGAEQLAIGAIVPQARVLRIGRGGLVVRLGKRNKGMVSFRALRSAGHQQANFDADELMAKYHKNSVHRVRITGYDAMDSLYVCTTNERLLAEKHFTSDDVAVGDHVDGRLVHALPDGGWFVRVGQVNAYLERVQISASTPAAKLVQGGTLRCRVLRKHEKDRKVFLSNRKEWMAEEALLLRSAEKAVVGLDYHGMVAKVFADGWLVSFCQYVKGMLYRRNLSEEEAATAAYYRVGQILKFRVQCVRSDGFITLGLGAFVCQTGTAMSGRVAAVDENGLNVAFPDAKLNGFVPAMLLTDFAALRPLMHQTYAPNERVDAVCVAQNVYSVRDVERVRVQPVRRWSEVRVGDVLPAYVKDVRGDCIELMCLIEQYARVVRVHVKMLLEDYTRETRIDLVPEQLVYVRVLGKNEMLKTLTLSGKLSHVWTGDLRETAAQWRQFFGDLQRVQAYCEKIGNPLAAVRLGAVHEGKVTDVEDSRALVRLPGGVTGVISFENAREKRVTVGTVVKCLALWADYVENVVYLTAVAAYVQRVAESTSSTLPKSRLMNAAGLKADVLLIRDTVAVLLPRKCTQRLVYVPVRLHHNDLQPVVMHGVRVGDLANVRLLDADDEYPLAIFEGIHTMFGKFRVQRQQTREAKKLRELLRDRDVPEKKKSKKKGAVKAETTEEANDEVKLEFSGDAIKDEIADEVDDEDDIGFDASAGVDDSDLFFEDTIGAAGDASSINASISSGGPSSAKKAKSVEIKLEQLDGATAALAGDDCDSDDSEEEQFAAKKTAAVIKTKKNQKKTAATKRKFEKPTKPPIAATKLPGVSNFWTTNLADVHKSRQKQQRAHSDSDSDDDTETAAVPSTDNSAAPAAKKPKLSTADRFRLARNEEARVRSIEESYANADDQQPSTVDHHERLVMATPNSSLAWINYIVYHMQCNEMHRARTVARRALKKISFRDGEELLNVWLALLNLELRYGDKEQFDAVLAEAVQANEPFKVYERCLQMLVSVGKVEELSDMVLTMTKKFRAMPDCWTSTATALCEVGLVEKAQPLLNRALQSLPERDRKFAFHISIPQLND